jgi:hypothetical protein
MTAKEKLRHLVEGMSEAEARTALELVEREGDDPLTRALDDAPLDDEPTTLEEDAGAREALAEYERGETYSADEIKRELG